MRYEKVLKQFTGKILQIPPMYSAKKVGGKKLYELARKGKTIERKPVEVEIYELKLINYDLRTTYYKLRTPYGVLTIDIHCSSGTYIRALARDIGETLGTGAYLEELERTAIGPFKLEDATALKDLNKENWESKLRSVAETITKSITPPSLPLY